MKILFGCIVVLSLSFISCSSDSEEGAIDPIIGTWEGPSVQEGLGSIEMTIIITSLSENQKSGSLTSTFMDTGDCDKEIFFCDPFSCASDWVYRGRSGSSYLFSDVALPGSECVAVADIKLSFSGDDKLVGTASFDVSADNSGQIEVNMITLVRVK